MEFSVMARALTDSGAPGISCSVVAVWTGLATPSPPFVNASTYITGIKLDVCIKIIKTIKIYQFSFIHNIFFNDIEIHLTCIV